MKELMYLRLIKRALKEIGVVEFPQAFEFILEESFSVLVFQAFELNNFDGYGLVWIMKKSTGEIVLTFVYNGWVASADFVRGEESKILYFFAHVVLLRGVSILIERLEGFEGLGAQNHR